MKRKRFRYWKQTVLAMIIILAGLLYCFGAFWGEPLSQSGREDQIDPAFTGGESETQKEPQETETQQESESASLYVYVCGEVSDPGVYILTEGQRLYEAVDMAGGFTENAAPEALNLAQPVADGMKIDVPDKERAMSAQSDSFVWVNGAAQSSKVNINTASREQLMTLNGIGAARADAIIAYRNEHGPFQAVEDIMQVSGIKEAAFAKIKNDIVVR